MDDGRLDTLERLLLLHDENRPKPTLPAGFAAGVMREVRAKVLSRTTIWEVLGRMMWRIAPAGALAAMTMYGFALHAEHLFNQSILSLSLAGGGSLTTLASMVP